MSSSISRSIAVTAFLAAFSLSFAFSSHAAVITVRNVPADYPTIQAAVTAANSGDTIIVAASTTPYAEHVVINKSLTLQGAQAGVDARTRSGSETIVDGSSTDAPFAIYANSVTIDGFTVQNGANGQLYSGIWTETGHSGITIQNNIITNNGFGVWAQCSSSCLIQQNLFNGNNASNSPGNASVSADSTSGLTITNNLFENDNNGNPILLQAGGSGHSNLLVSTNTFTGNTNASVFYSLGISSSTISGNTVTAASDVTGISLSGGNTNVNVINNTITGAARGIRVEDPYSVGTNSNILVKENSFGTHSEYALGLLGGYTGTLNAEYNWWGTASGSGVSARINQSGGTVDFTPWYLQAAKTSTTTAAVGTTTLSSGSPVVAVDSSDTADSTINVPSNVTNGQIDFSQVESGNIATLPGNITVNASTTAGDFIVKFAAGTHITSPATWDGLLNLPQPANVGSIDPFNPGGFANHTDTSMEIGVSNQALTFDKGVRLVFVGKAGKLIAWMRSGTFTAIATTCASDSQTTGDALTAITGDCKIDVGADLVVWTKHFTTFVTYTQTANPPASTGGGGGGGGGGPVGLIGSTNTNTPSAPVSSAAPASSGTGTGVGNGGGVVLGAATFKFNKNLGYGMHGTDVSELQKRLVAEGYSIPDAVTLYFGPETRAAVKAYQKAHGIVQTGFVGVLTRGQLNAQ